MRCLIKIFILIKLISLNNGFCLLRERKCLWSPIKPQALVRACTCVTPLQRHSGLTQLVSDSLGSAPLSSPRSSSSAQGALADMKALGVISHRSSDAGTLAAAI